jgi:ribonuclease HI
MNASYGNVILVKKKDIPLLQREEDERKRRLRIAAAEVAGEFRCVRKYLLKTVRHVDNYITLPEKQTARHMNFEIYTDGGFTQTHYCGAWAYVIRAKDVNPFNGQKRCRFTFHENAGPCNTNILMCEIMAVVNALEYLKNHLYDKIHDIPIVVDSAIVKTDSSQVAECEERVQKYKEQSWLSYITGNQIPIDLITSWTKLDNIRRQYGSELKFEWIKGHSGILYNDRCDKMCQKIIAKQVKSK